MNILLVRYGICRQQYETFCVCNLLFVRNIELYPAKSYILRNACMLHLSLWQEHGYRQEIASSSCSSISARLLQHTTTGITWNHWTDRKFI